MTDCILDFLLEQRSLPSKGSVIVSNNWEVLVQALIVSLLSIFVATLVQAATKASSECEYNANVSVFTSDGKLVSEKSFSTEVIRRMTRPGNYQFSEDTKNKSGQSRIDFALTWVKAPFHVESELGTVSGVCSSLGSCAGKTIGKADAKTNSSFVTQFDSKFVRVSSITDSSIVIQELKPKKGECPFH